jgi:ribosomal protein L12E/L44/L45/RPP1/RPP2
MLAGASLIQIVGREAVEQKLAEILEDVEVDLEMHKVNPIPLNGVA